MTVLMSSIFEDLDFERFEHPASSEPAYRTRFGPHEIETVLLTNRWFQKGWMLGGVVNTTRTVGIVEGELPLVVETKEQGLALLSYFLARQIPEQFKPPWLRIGERMTSHLPWVRQGQGAKLEA